MNQSNETLTIHATHINSTQNWTVDPDMIEVTLTKSFLLKAQMCIDFMQANQVEHVAFSDGVAYELYHDVDNADEVADEDQVTISVDGKEFTVFEPEYELSGHNAKIDRYGFIYLELAFAKADELWCEVGNIADLMKLPSHSDSPDRNNPHATSESQKTVTAGTNIFWTDADGKQSGIHSVDQILTEPNSIESDESPVLLRCGHYTREVLAGEISPVKTDEAASEVPQPGQFQSYLYDADTESGFIIRNEGDGKFKAEEWFHGDIVDVAYGSYAAMKQWTEADSAARQAWRKSCSEAAQAN